LYSTGQGTKNWFFSTGEGEKLTRDWGGGKRSSKHDRRGTKRVIISPKTETPREFQEARTTKQRQNENFHGRGKKKGGD